MFSFKTFIFLMF